MNAPTPTPVPAPPALAKLVKPPTVLLMGPAGVGKTDSIMTLIEAGLETFVIGTEGNFLDTLFDSATRRKLPLDKLHWHYVPPSSPGLDALEEMAKKIGYMSYEDLSKQKSGISKDNTQQFRAFLETLKGFKDDRDGKSYGSVFAFDSSRALVVDSFSGLSTMAMDLTVGMKPTAAQGEWGVAMNLVEKTILKLTSDLNCMFVLISHIEREVDEVAGGTKIMTSTLGRKLAPKIPKMFSEVVLARRGKTDKDFKWSTASDLADLKNRALPISDNIEPSFRVIWEAHQRRLKQLGVSSA